MHDRQIWVPPDHARPRVAHHEAHLFALRWTVTVNLAIGAGGLVFTIGTAGEAFLRVITQARALGAQRVVVAVMVTAVDAQHHLDGLQLARQPRLPQSSVTLFGGRHAGMLRTAARCVLRWIKKRARSTHFGTIGLRGRATRSRPAYIPWRRTGRGERTSWAHRSDAAPTRRVPRSALVWRIPAPLRESRCAERRFELLRARSHLEALLIGDACVLEAPSVIDP